MAPPHDGGIPDFGSSVKDIVPGDQLMAFFRDDSRHLLQEPAFDLFQVLDTFTFHQSLDVRVVVPAGTAEVDLVSSDVNIFTGEKGENLVKHIRNELVDPVAAHIEGELGIGVRRIHSSHQPGVGPACG